MGPDFTKQTVEVLARRARFQCSNPDCGIHTVGPNSAEDKATTIGEAAHIFGAKPASTRFDESMSDTTRASVTNGIWLCRTCHGRVDRDGVMFPAALLFAWRKAHEERVLCELGTRGERIRHEVETAAIHFLNGYPEIVQRIAADKPLGWEWRLAAELLRHLNAPHVKRLKNLLAGHYYRPYPRVKSEDFIGWLHGRTHVMSKLIDPLSPLYDRLNAAFGPPGQSGDMEEIHDVCLLLSDMTGEIVNHEETLRFTLLPDEGEELREILMDALGRNLFSLTEIPDVLDKVVSMIGTDHGGTREEPHMIVWTAKFELPQRFVENYEEALQRYRRLIGY